MLSVELESLRNALREKAEEVLQLHAELAFAEEMFAKLTARAEREDESGLPVPRLEIRWIGEEQEPEGRWEYNLVLNHFTGNPCFYSLGSTEVTGGAEPFNQNGKIRLPLRDGAHIKHDMKELKLHAFAIRGGIVENLSAA